MGPDHHHPHAADRRCIRRPTAGHTQVDLGGDDSVAGAVFYVWLDEQFDVSGPIGWRSTVVLVGDVCARGGSVGRDICV